MILPLILNNSNNNKYQNKYNKISFSGCEQKACGYLRNSVKSSVQDVTYAYKDIYSRLFSQNAEVIKRVQNGFKDINISDISKGIDILNAGGNPDKVVNISMPRKSDFKEYIQLQLKNASSNEVEKTFLIADSDKVVRCGGGDFLCRKELEDANIEKEIENFLNIIDFPLLKLRRSVSDIAPVNFPYHPVERVSLVVKRDIPNASVLPALKESHHKSNRAVVRTVSKTEVKNPVKAKVNYAAIAGKFDETSENLIASVTDRLNRVKQIFAGYSESKGLRIKNAYPDIQLKGSKNGGYSFKNAGDNNEIVTIHDVDNKKHGRLIRLMIENPADNSIKTFLISDSRVVANTNPKFPMFTPETLKYLSADEIKSVEPEITKYFNLYDEKLRDFEIFASEDLRIKKPSGRKAAAEKKTVEPRIKIKPEKVKLPDALLPADVSDDLKRASEIAEKSSEMLSELSSSVAFKIKSEYKDVEVAHGQKMLIFSNTTDSNIEKLGILNLQRKDLNLIKFLVQKKGEEPKYFLFDAYSKVVSNYKAETNQIPPVFKYADEQYIQQADLCSYIKVLKDKLEDYSAYIEKEVKARKMFSNSVTKTDFVDLINSLQFPKKKIYSEEYQNIMSECFADFSKVVKDIQEKIKKFTD